MRGEGVSTIDAALTVMLGGQLLVKLAFGKYNELLNIIW